MDFDEIIIHCKNGEKEYFEILIKSIEIKAFKTAMYICGDRELALDILQETYVKCFTEINKLKDSKAFKSWFFKILTRNAWKMCKIQSKCIPLDINSVKEDIFFNNISSPKSDIVDIETRTVIFDAVNMLSVKLKTVVILYYYNDMTIEEIAYSTGTLKTTVKSRLFYARKELKKYFEKNSTDPDLLSQCYETGSFL